MDRKNHRSATAYCPMAEDVTIVGSEPRGTPELTLVSIFRNEAYLLPTFLAHYRALGVTRFILLDDRSDDASRALIGEEPDVMLLESARRYGDPVATAERPPGIDAASGYRQVHLWRTGLANRFCDGRWMVQCDIDELACLPPGETLRGLADRLGDAGHAGAWGGMIDLYPHHIRDLGPDAPAAADPTAGDWYFDGVRHFSTRRNGPPLHHYTGARYRLGTTYLEPDRRLPVWKALRMRWLGLRKSPSGRFVKPLLQHWRRGNHYLSSHVTTRPLSPHHLVPLMHYRYTPALVAKVAWAIESGGYSKGNADYRALDRLLAEMTARDGAFTDARSRRFGGYADLKATGNAAGLE